ncbi:MULTISPECIES: hypothetical protein [unclassified Meiothermus]|uniref:hypothetical protein n=1 Tax=unclassified Meiothermus TaxID=370471 RepID=UPI000D7D0853|nr:MULTISPECIES: hypothetical protein [unclassified Meiothermus]PZA07304.1 hypothetical protein DNA98_08890 [Meiothermus sp. Pnk-1]RYM29202.1 hypothetical protein EWH23_16175 [Meiothermus sp. PNK-Is4]
MIRFPGGRVWQVEEWIFWGLWQDARPHLKGLPELARRLYPMLDAAEPRLDLRGAERECVRQLRLLVMLVRRDNLRLKGRNFADLEGFTAYMRALEDLLALAAEES